MESTLYSRLFKKLIEEDSFGGAAGVFGDTQVLYDPDGQINSADNYATGDHRNIFDNKKKPTVTSRKGKVKTAKKKKAKKKRKTLKESFTDAEEETYYELHNMFADKLNAFAGKQGFDGKELTGNKVAMYIFQYVLPDEKRPMWKQHSEYGKFIIDQLQEIGIDAELIKSYIHLTKTFAKRSEDERKNREL